MDNGKKNPYYLKNISFSRVKCGRYFGEEQYELEFRYKDIRNISQIKFYTIFYDEEEKKNLINKKCWHCLIPFHSINYRGSYFENQFHELVSQDQMDGYVCKNCFFFLYLYNYKRNYYFICASCGSRKNIIYANTKPSNCLNSYFDAHRDLLCIGCCKNIIKYL